MQRYFINKIVKNQVSFNKSDENHIIKVMRMKLNDEVVAIYENKKYLVKLTSLTPLRAEIIKQIIDNTKNPFSLNVFQASIKPKYMELAIQKACELNVDNFYIYNSYYSQLNINHHYERYLKIIKEACEQANRATLMNLNILTNNNELINLLNTNDINLIADFKTEQFLSNWDQAFNNDQLKIGLVIGPEGGFCELDYENVFNHSKYFVVSLTKTILRAETAMMYLVSVVSYILLKNEKAY